jgi:hypothetical protein
LWRVEAGGGEASRRHWEDDRFSVSSFRLRISTDSSSGLYGLRDMMKFCMRLLGWVPRRNNTSKTGRGEMMRGLCFARVESVFSNRCRRCHRYRTSLPCRYLALKTCAVPAASCDTALQSSSDLLAVRCRHLVCSRCNTSAFV